MDPTHPQPLGAPPAFRAEKPTVKPLTLPRRVSLLQRAHEASQASAETRRSIDAIISQSRSPWGEAPQAMSVDKVQELEKMLRSLEGKLAERDITIAEAVYRLAERERELAEMEALHEARERVARTMPQPAQTEGPSSLEQSDAFQKLKEELDRQEQSIREQRVAMQEQVEFMEQSEAALFDKMQKQQEKETELEQLGEEVRRKMRQLGLLPVETPEPMEKA